MTDEPLGLDALLAWYRYEVEGGIPRTLHKSDLDAGGAPEYSGAFFRYLKANARATNDDGDITDPIAFWLGAWQNKKGRDARRAKFLYRLARLDFDWREAVHARRSMSKWADDMAEAYTLASLRIFWNMMQVVPAPRVRVREKSEAQHAAEAAA